MKMVLHRDVNGESGWNNEMKEEGTVVHGLTIKSIIIYNKETKLFLELKV